MQIIVADPAYRPVTIILETQDDFEKTDGTYDPAAHALSIVCAVTLSISNRITVTREVADARGRIRGTIETHCPQVSAARTRRGHGSRGGCVELRARAGGRLSGDRACFPHRVSPARRGEVTA